MVWNLFTRFLHWLVAVPVLLNFFLDGEDNPHRVAGYVALGGVFVRIMWGFFAQDKANFEYFPLNHKITSQFIKKVIQGEKVDFEGHNPMASWVYVLMWISITALGITGFLMGTDRFWGETWLENLHEWFAVGLQGLVALHFTGIILDGIRFKRKTWMGMIDGKKSDIIRESNL